MSDVDLIREALVDASQELDMEGFARISDDCDRALALLDGVTRLAREGDVVLSAKQAAKVQDALRYDARWYGTTEQRRVALALLASGRPGEEQA